MINLNNIKMNVINTSENGVVNSDTHFHFMQTGNFVQAQYSGGKIREGQLIGILTNDKLKFTYCQLRITGEMDHGVSECTVSKEEGSNKIKLEERFEMDTDQSRQVGINIFMEL